MTTHSPRTTHHAPPLRTDLRTRAAYAEGAGIYRIVPRAVTAPESVDDVRRLVAWAMETRTPLTPRGAGSGMPGHNVGRHVVVDMSRGFRDLAVDPRRRRARAGASVTWADVSAAAGAHGLRLPPDPSSGAFATCGGLVSTNAAGPRSVRYGSVRRWIEAIDVVGAGGDVRTLRRGEGPGPWHLTPDTRHLVHRFPKTRKNSSGYALDAFAASGDELDLFVGAEGTLGLVTAVEWRLEPIPPHRAGAALGFRDVTALADAVPFLLGLDPSSIELLDATLLELVARVGADLPAGLEGLLLVEFERETAAAAQGIVGDAVRGLDDLAAYVETAVDGDALERLWAVRRLASPALARLPPTARSLQVVEDGCVPIERLGDYLGALRGAATRRGVPVVMFGHAGDGHVHANTLPDVTRAGWRDGLLALYDDVTALLVDLGGTPSGEHGDGRLRAGVLGRFFGPEGVAAFHDLKRAYDPLSIFNPGVIIPAADWAPLADLKIGPDATPIPDDIAARLRDIERGAAWGTPKAELAGMP